MKLRRGFRPFREKKLFAKRKSTESELEGGGESSYFFCKEKKKKVFPDSTAKGEKEVSSKEKRTNCRLIFGMKEKKKNPIQEKRRHHD